MRPSTCSLATLPTLVTKFRTGSGPNLIISSSCRRLTLEQKQWKGPYFSTRGWKAYGVEATGNGGTTGGFLTLHGQRHLTHHVQTYTKEGNGWTALGLQREGTFILLIQVYLRTGETLQSPQNADLLSKLLNLLDHTHAPFIIGGDWQNSPESMAATVILSKFNCQILDTQQATTLHGSQLDYLLVSNALLSSVQLTAADWEVPGNRTVGLLSP